MTSASCNAARPGGPPPIIEHAGERLSRYDVIFCDVWGVVHNGVTAFDKACAALARFRQRGGTVILVSNAPVPKHRVEAMLQSRRVPGDAWDDIVSSGDIALKHVEACAMTSLYCIGPQDRDAAMFAAVAARPAPLEDAEAILCTGLTDDRRETPGDYRPLLDRALALKLPFVCANPDFVVDVGGTLLYCAGAIADIYESIGGEVYWAGKPHRNAYETAHAKADALRGSRTPIGRCLVIGDALRTDIQGAANYGVDAIFVASGIHRHETMDAGRLSPAKLATLFAPDRPSAIAAMVELAW